MSRVKELLLKSKETLKEDGLRGFITKSKKYISYKIQSRKSPYDKGFKDVLFINGCSLPHPQRYRVDHQIEQLEAFGVHCDKKYYADLSLEQVRYYRAFVFYRCPVLPVIEEFIKIAKDNNKAVFYDIDDLVFDTKYTDNIPYVKSLNKDDRKLYDDGVIRMGKTLSLCDYATCSTTRLAKEMAPYVQDVFVNRNVASETMVALSKKALKENKREDSKIIIGYLSGTITHNSDFEMIRPVIKNILSKYDNVYLKIVGLLDLSDELNEYKDKIITAPFVDWTELPNLIRSTDINIAPLEDNIFNEAKSENKWTEAALVKVPVVASNIGAFKESIVDGKTGFLCSNSTEWEEKLSLLINDIELRNKIGENAYNEVIKTHTTINSGINLANFIKSKMKRNFCFVLPSTNVSGGIMVAVKHGLILKNAGYDVTILNVNEETKDVDRIYENDDYLNVVSIYRTELLMNIDTMIATMWLTLPLIQTYPNCLNKKYLVQGMETMFYENGRYERILANQTYNNVPNIEYLTVSKWCYNWLRNDFHNSCKYARNGIDLSMFNYKNRTFKNKIKILIEGNPDDFYKNVDESFKIVNKLDKDKFEINFLSYQGKGKDWYYVDNFYHRIPHSQVSKIYEESDILLKSSYLESFSYPPLEMMATGGVCVVVPNDGNVEYLVDNENCLMYKQGDIDEALKKIELLVSNKKLRDKLIQNGLKTAKSRNWNDIENDVLNLYL